MGNSKEESRVIVYPNEPHPLDAQDKMDDA